MQNKVIEPCEEALKILGLINEVAESYIIGRSLISNDSKDIDFMVIGGKEVFDDILKISYIRQHKTMSGSENGDYISDDFPWAGIIKGSIFSDYKFDILFCDFEKDIKKIIKGFPITKQHVAYDISGEFIFSEYFEAELLELSPERRQKTYSDGLKRVMKKYCKYYPTEGIGDIFYEVLKEMAFYNNVMPNIMSEEELCNLK